MKTFLLAFTFAVAVWLRASAQIAVQIDSAQDEFLPCEAVVLAVKITNTSGQRLHFGDDPAWLTFSVESADGFIVVKNAEVPVFGPFDLESSQMGIKRVDIQPYFSISRPGRYKVTATLRVKEWSSQVTSSPKIFDVVTGVKFWSQDFGVPSANGGAPEMRKFTLEEANYLKQQLRLYVQVSDTEEAHVFKVAALGPMVSFGLPEAKVDRLSRLHVLWQTGGQTFSYCVVMADGAVTQREVYSNFTGRPQLAVNETGDVVVVGGVRRADPVDLPMAKTPDSLPSAPLPSAQTNQTN